MLILQLLAVLSEQSILPWSVDARQVLNDLLSERIIKHLSGSLARVTDDGSIVLWTKYVGDGLSSLHTMRVKDGVQTSWPEFRLFTTPSRDVYAASFGSSTGASGQGANALAIQKALGTDSLWFDPENRASYLHPPMAATAFGCYSLWSTTIDAPSHFLGKPPRANRQGIIRVSFQDSGAKYQQVLFALPYGPCIAWFDHRSSHVAISKPMLQSRSSTGNKAMQSTVLRSVTELYRATDGRLMPLKSPEWPSALRGLANKSLNGKVVVQIEDNMRYALLCSTVPGWPGTIEWYVGADGKPVGSFWEMDLRTRAQRAIPWPRQEKRTVLMYLAGRLIAYDRHTTSDLALDRTSWYLWDRKARKWLSGGNSRLVGYSASGKYLLLYADGKLHLVQPKWSAWPGGTTTLNQLFVLGKGIPT